MSIIYATLERLETDDPPLELKKKEINSPPLLVEPGGSPKKTVATALLLVMAGANALLWYWSNEAGVRPNPVPATPVSQSVASGKSEHALLPASVEEQPSVSLPSIESDRDTTTERHVASVEATLTHSLTDTDKQHIAQEKVIPTRDSIEQPSRVAGEGVEPVSSPVVKPETSNAEQVDRKQILPADTAHEDGVEEVIEQARLALSRARYQRALSTLETLKRVPDNRADYWLIKGSAHLGIGQLDLAEMAFASAQELVPDNAQIAVQQAILKQEKGDHAGALQILKGATVRHPNVPEIFLNQGYSQQASGFEREARRSFRAFLKLTEGRSVYEPQRRAVKEWLAPVSSIQE